MYTYKKALLIVNWDESGESGMLIIWKKDKTQMIENNCELMFFSY